MFTYSLYNFFLKAYRIKRMTLIKTTLPLLSFDIHRNGQCESVTKHRAFASVWHVTSQS